MHGTPPLCNAPTPPYLPPQAQLCYCTAAVFAALFPTAAHPRALQRLGRSLATFRGVAAALALFALALLAVHQGTVAHPYLLADNRHFSFYLWKARRAMSRLRCIAHALSHVSFRLFLLVHAAVRS